MLSKPILREVMRVSVCILALGAIMVAVFALFGKFDMTVLLGAILGCVYACLNFALTAKSVERSAEAGSESAAKMKMMSGYYFRLILAAAVMFWAIKAPYFNMWAAVIPFIFPRISIYIISITDRIRRGSKE